MGFLKRLFGNEPTQQRRVDHPRNLQKGDIISLDDSLILPPQLRGQPFEVEAINTYEFEHQLQPEWVLKGQSNDTVFLAVDEDDDNLINLSIKINRHQVEQIFNTDQFGDIFSEGVTAHLQVGNDIPPHLEQWLATKYDQVNFAEFGYFHQQDYRDLKPPKTQIDADGQPFEGYRLLDDAEQYGVDVEVYQDGDTDVILTLCRPLSDIREYWPAKTK